MWERQYSEQFSWVTAKEVWCHWIDINKWPEWHNDLDGCNLNGEFAVGNSFTLKPKGMKPVKIKITKLIEGESFTDCTRFWGAKMFDTHTVVSTGQGVEINNVLTMTGPLSFFWFFLVGRHVAKTIPAETKALISRIKEVQRG